MKPSTAGLILLACLTVRTCPATVRFVTDTSDHGPGTLRNTIAASANGDVINFGVGGVITLTSGELLLTNSLTIDASSLANGITINGNSTNRVFETAAGTTNILIALVITNGLDTNNTAVVGGAPGGGGGGGIRNGGTLTLTRCVVSGNRAAFGGGVRNEGTLTADRSTLSGNTATSSNGGGVNNASTLVMNQCTIASNTATNLGGGLRNTGISTATMALTNCTISGNLAASSGGGGINNGGSNIVIYASIVAGNHTATSGEIVGSISDAGFNFLSGDPMLGPLGGYGFLTPTMPLLNGSSAIDNGSDAVTNYFATDQRGLPRKSGLRVDIGAVESLFPAAAPMVTSQFASDQDFVSATLNASVTPNGAVTTCYFEYGATTNYGFVTGNINLSGGIQIVSSVVGGLSAETFYHFRTVASNVNGTNIGPDVRFKTRGTNLVDNLGDNGPGTLREAMAFAAPGDIIGFTIGLSGSITLSNGPLVISTNASIIGPGSDQLIISGNYASAVMIISNGTVSISGLTIANGTNANYAGAGPVLFGAGIQNWASLIISNVIIADNKGCAIECYNSGILTVLNTAFLRNDGGRLAGAGIRAHYPNTLTVDGCLFAGSKGGGAIYTETISSIKNTTFTTNSGCIGGGIGNIGITAISSCTFCSNTACAGGAILNYYQAQLTNCTFYGNSNSSGSIGGGAIDFIPDFAGSSLLLSHCTVSGNQSPSSGGGICLSPGASSGQLVIEGSIIAGNSSTSGPDVFGTVISQGYNLIGAQDQSSGWISSDITGTVGSPINPLLGTLQDNGGPTFTMTPLLGSPAIDAAQANGSSFDQRCAPRPNDNPFKANPSGGDGSDIGALEVAPVLNISVAGGGTVLERPEPLYLLYGSTVRLDGLPSTGWSFANWSGDATGSANPLGIVMTTNKSVTAHFNAGASACATAPSGIVGWWPGAGNGNDIIGDNNAQLAYGPTFVAGKVGQAFSRTGTNAVIYVQPNSTLKFTSDFTLEAWIQPSAALTNNQQILALSDQSGKFFMLEAMTNGGLGFEGYDGIAFYQNAAPASLSPGTWSHVAVSFNFGTVTLFRNGASLLTTPTSLSLFSAPTAMFIGGIQASGFNPFSGLLDEVSVYNRTLSPSEILSIFGAGSAGKCLMPLYITDINHTSNSANLSWLAQKGMGYRVQYTTNLNSMVWSNLPPDVTAASDTATQTDSTSSNAPQRFYRVQVLP